MGIYQAGKLTVTQADIFLPGWSLAGDVRLGSYELAEHVRWADLVCVHEILRCNRLVVSVQHHPPLEPTGRPAGVVVADHMILEGWVRRAQAAASATGTVFA